MTKYDNLLLHYANLIGEALDTNVKDSVAVLAMMQQKETYEDFQWMSLFLAGYILYIHDIPAETDIMEVETFKEEMGELYKRIREVRKGYNTSSLQGLTFGTKNYDA